MRTPVKRNAGKSAAAGAAGGAILGAVAAGPVGALAGAAIGLSASVYDSKYRSEDAARELAGFLGPDEKDYSHIERKDDGSRGIYTPEEELNLNAGARTFREERLRNTKALDGTVDSIADEDIIARNKANSSKIGIRQVSFAERHKQEMDRMRGTKWNSRTIKISGRN
jgi:hypothetical protein